MEYRISPIGYITSPFQEKFGTPRQPNLIESSQGELRLVAPYNDPNIVKGLEQFSHIWLIFMFDKTLQQGWKSMVRPPRLGGNEKLGVFATRSNFRPNPIGLSAVRLKKISVLKDEIILHLGSLDLIDGTPVIDIKPYIPYSDAIIEARAGFAQIKPETKLLVSFTEEAESVILNKKEFKQLIIETIELDPRPAYKKDDPASQDYGVKLNHCNIKFTVQGNRALIYEIT